MMVNSISEKMLSPEAQLLAVVLPTKSRLIAGVSVLCVKLFFMLLGYGIRPKGFVAGQ